MGRNAARNSCGIKLPKIQKNNRMVNLSTIDVVDGNQASAEFKISSDSLQNCIFVSDLLDREE
jgi:hypothetical protein